MEASVFPRYRAAEAATDRAIHLLALPAAIGAVGWLVLIAIRAADTPKAVALAIYGCGLMSMLTASTAYNLSRPCRRKELLAGIMLCTAPRHQLRPA
jgi:hemolysin III